MATKYQHYPVSSEQLSKDYEGWYPVFNGLPKEEHFKGMIEDISLDLAASIPNPLARLYLFDNAFKHFADRLKKGDSAFDGSYAEFVSDCLDFLQWLFESKGEGVFTTADWKFKGQVEKLKGGTEGQRKLASAFDLYLEELSADKITLYYYNRKTDKGAEKFLIGGSSPLSAVYTTPNWRKLVADKKIEVKAQDSSDIFFDDELKGLHDRNVQFRYFLYSSTNSLPGNLKSYVNAVKARFDADFDERVQSEEGIISILKLESEVVFNLYGFEIKRAVNTAVNSDFKIKSERQITNNVFGGKDPLILTINMPSGRYYNDTKYPETSQLNMSVPIDKRALPGTEGNPIFYPWLTVGDFFEESLIYLPYEFNSEQFYTPAVNGESSGFKYLLPLKPLFFEFFNTGKVSELLSVEFDGENVSFKLIIPTTSDKSVELVKSYPRKVQNEADLNVALFPILKPKTESTSVFNYAMLYYNVEGNTDCSLSFFNSHEMPHKHKQDDWRNAALTPVHQNTRDVDVDLVRTRHYEFKENYDIISVEAQSKRGWILPKFEKPGPRSGDELIFGIDFGTSNSFVAYREGTQELKPLAISCNILSAVLNKKAPNGDPFLLSNSISFAKAVESQFAPYQIGGRAYKSGNEDIKIEFPLRTVSTYTSEFSGVDSAKTLFQYSGISFYYEYDQNDNQPYSYKSNIKTDFGLRPEGDTKNQVENYLREILLLVKLKMTELGYKISDEIKIIWTYPAVGSFKGNLEKIMVTMGKEVFGDDFAKNKIKALSESQAPVTYLKQRKEGTRNVLDYSGVLLNVDIGGGTTDIAIHDPNRNKISVSSVKFAGNDLWGGGFDAKERDNAYSLAWEKLKNDNLQKAVENEYKRYKTLNKRISTVASDKTNLLFKYNQRLEFTNMLGIESPDHRLLKLPMVLHFGAILYYIIRLCEKKGINRIGALNFSGKGSSYLRLLFGDDSRKLSAFIVTYFGKYASEQGKKVISVDDDRDGNLKIKMLDNPKEITAYGAIYAYSQNYSVENSVEPEPFYFLDYKPEAADEDDMDKQVEAEKERDEVTLKEEVITQALNGYKILTKMKTHVESIIGEGNFLRLYKELLNKGNKPYMQFVLEQSYDDYRSFVSIAGNESFFFYPFKGALHKIGMEIYHQYLKSE